MTRWTIYCHTHIESGRRYVGLTQRMWQERWRGHIHLAKFRATTHFARAIRKYGKEAFSHEVLEVCHSLDVANLAEECWIELFETRDPEKGFNLAKGGASQPHPIRDNPWDRPEYREKASKNIVHCLTPEAREKQLASLRSPESKAKRSALTTASMARPEVIAKRRVFQDDPEYRRMISETTKAGLADPAVREKVSAGVREVWKRPEVREKILARVKATISTPESRVRRSESTKKSWRDPETRARRMEAFRADAARPEKKALLSKASLGRHHTAESVELQRQLYLQRSCICKFCGSPIEGKRTCIKGRVACFGCYGLHKAGLANFLRPGGSFL